MALTAKEREKLLAQEKAGERAERVRRKALRKEHPEELGFEGVDQDLRSKDFVAAYNQAIDDGFEGEKTPGGWLADAYARALLTGIDPKRRALTNEGKMTTAFADWAQPHMGAISVSEGDSWSGIFGLIPQAGAAAEKCARAWTRGDEQVAANELRRALRILSTST